MTINFLDLTIKEIHKALIEKKITPLDLTKEALRRAKNDSNNAFEYIAEKEAIELASKLKEPEKDNLLWGIPFTIKDNFSTKNIPTCASSNILKGYIPIFNATVVEKLIDKKAILIGKTTLDELAMNGTGKTGHLGSTFNPYDIKHEHIIGGSSCGSAVTVANNIVPFSIGSDTGDSVRKPASYAGLVGFKPTWSLISRFGLFPFVNSLDTVGFFTRSVEDAGILLNVLAGYDSKDFTSYKKKININYLSKLNDSINNTKIIVIKEIIDSIKDNTIVCKFNEIIEILKLLGVKVVFVSLDKKILKTLFLTYYIIACAEATSNNANLDGIKFGFTNNESSEIKNYKEILLHNRSIGFSKFIKKRFIFGSYVLMKENQKELFLKAKKNRHRIVNNINQILNNYDALLLPATSSIAPKFSDNIVYDDEYLIANNHMIIANFAGLPSITIPMGFKKNLPFGLNITGKIFTESKILNIAKIIEDKLKFYNLNAVDFRKRNG